MFSKFRSTKNQLDIYLYLCVILKRSGVLLLTIPSIIYLSRSCRKVKIESVKDYYSAGNGMKIFKWDLMNIKKQHERFSELRGLIEAILKRAHPLQKDFILINDALGERGIMD